MADIDSLINKIENILKVPKLKSATIPNPLIIKTKDRAGLSVTELTTRALSKMADKGYKVGTNVDGSPDAMGDLIEIIIDVIINAIQNDAKITVSIQPGIPITGVAGIFPVVGSTSSFGTGGAIIQ
jgi:hypothetical protein